MSWIPRRPSACSRSRASPAPLWEGRVAGRDDGVPAIGVGLHGPLAHWSRTLAAGGRGQTRQCMIIYVLTGGAGGQKRDPIGMTVACTV